MAASTKTKSRKSAPRLPAPELNGKQRRYLRSLAHGLQPVLQVGKSGPSETLLKELDRALDAHELVKIRVLRECPTELDEILALAEKTLAAAPVGTTGKVAVLYRRRANDPRIALPDLAASAKPKKPTKAEESMSDAADEDRPRKRTTGAAPPRDRGTAPRSVKQRYAAGAASGGTKKSTGHAKSFGASAAKPFRAAGTKRPRASSRRGPPEWS